MKSTVSPDGAGLLSLNGWLSERDIAIIRSVHACRLITAGQIERLHFGDNGSQLTGARICRRVLKRLTEDGYLRRRERRVGGIRAGSASFIYSLGPRGARLASERRLHYYIQDPSPYFMEHTLALAELYVGLHTSSLSDTFEILRLETEPECWRNFTTLAAGRQTLKPDMLAMVSTDRDEFSYFFEMDRGTTFAASLQKKLSTYESYYLSGKEQRTYGIFPQVLWLVPDNKRQTLLERLFAPLNERIPGICKAAVSTGAIKAMLNPRPP